MTATIAAWVRGLVGTAVICAVALALCPSGRVHRVLNLICGAVMAVSLLAPVASFDFAEYSSSLAKYRESALNSSVSGKDTAQRLNRAIIEGECAAYILDKADALGVTVIQAEVRAEWNDEGYWFPSACTIAATDPISPALEDAIAAELGIPPSRQTWEGEYERSVRKA